MLIAGNWKMNTDAASASRLAQDVCTGVGDPGSVHVAVCPPFVHLTAVGDALQGTPVRLGAQNMHAEISGAYTGEVSGAMLASVGCHYVILGHSERRQNFGETDALVSAKVRRALTFGLIPIICVGEVLAERKAGRQRQVVGIQVRGALKDVEHADSLVIAYEPVWAIGTGETATSDQAQSMHAYIRTLLVGQFGRAGAAGIQILYGGSMKPANAADLISLPDVDGGLIGGASLSGESFAAIVRAGQAAV